MKKKARWLIVLVLAFCFIPARANAETVVEKRLSAVVSEYPDGSVMNDSVCVNGMEGGGCNALVMYATLKMFHNAYDPGQDTFSQIGKTTSVTDVSSMKKLFQKAKVGDVIRWRKEYTDSHFAIYLSHNDKGIYVYECNFGKKNKVWYKHFWAWKYMKTWPSGGANKVNLYRSNNYDEVNKKKAALNYRKGDVFEIQGSQYRVIKNGAIEGVVKFVGYIDSVQPKAVPKFLYINRKATNGENCNDKSGGSASRKCRLNAQFMYRVKR